MKIGTLSINVNTDDLNHGAVLHSWAFSNYLKKRYNCEVEIIDYVTERLENEDLRHPFKVLLKESKWKAAIVSLLSKKSYERRYDKFQDFKNEKMEFTKTQYSKSSLSNAVLDFDILFCESDVIWDPSYFGGRFDESFFFNFDNMRSIKKIAYSPSLGNMNLNKEHIDSFLRLIKNFDAISFREEYATKYMTNSFGLKATTVLDPVLLLKKEDYTKLINDFHLVSEPYILFYTPMSYSLTAIRRVNRYAKERGLKVVEISRYSFDAIFHKTFSGIGVEEFLSLFYYADRVITNSFHGVCFSIIFEKQFFAFHRTTGKKTKDLCERLGLLDRYINMSNTPNELNDNRIDYRLVNNRLNELKKISMAFIDESLGGDFDE